MSIGTLANGLDATTVSTMPGFVSNPNPKGMEMEIAGSASRAFEMKAVARL